MGEGDNGDGGDGGVSHVRTTSTTTPATALFSDTGGAPGIMSIHLRSSDPHIAAGPSVPSEMLLMDITKHSIPEA